MKDSRIGETLWSEWQGEGHRPEGSSLLTFFTETHVDIDHDLIKRALASAIQREGVVDSLGEAYRSVENSKVHHLVAGKLDESDELHICDLSGETFYGDVVDSIIEITLVDLNV